MSWLQSFTGHLGNCMNLLAEMVQEMRIKHNLSTRGMAQGCPHFLATILHLPHIQNLALTYSGNKHENSAFPALMIVEGWTMFPAPIIHHSCSMKYSFLTCVKGGRYRATILEIVESNVCTMGTQIPSIMHIHYFYNYCIVQNCSEQPKDKGQTN